MKKKMVILALFSVFTVIKVCATTYFPTPISNQISSAYGIVQGVFQGFSYKKEQGIVVTVFNFGIEKHIGFKKNEILNRNSFLVSTPGGVWNGVNYNIPGSPKFNKGEKVVLLINKVGTGFSLQNLALGKYSMFKREGAIYLKSSVFPEHNRLGKIKYDDFLKMAQRKFNTEFISFKGTPRYYTKEKNDYFYFRNKAQVEELSRVPASISMKSSKEESSGYFWPFLLLIIVAFYTVFIINKK